MDKVWDNLGVLERPRASMFPSEFSFSSFPGHFRGSRKLVRDWSHQVSSSLESGFHFKSFHGSKVGRKDPFDNKLETFELANSLPDFQDDHYQTGQTADNPWNVDDLPGPSGRIFACPGSRRLPKIPRIHLERTTMGFQDDAFRSVCGSSLVYDDNEASNKLLTWERHSCSSISGRLSDLERVKGELRRGYADRHRHVVGIRLHNKLEKMFPIPLSISPLVGTNLGHLQKQSWPHQVISGKDPVENQVYDCSNICVKERPRSLDRPPELCLPGTAFRDFSSLPNHKMDESRNKSSFSRSKSVHFGTEKPSALVEIQSKSNPLHTVSGQSPTDDYFDGRFIGRMGGNLRRSVSSGNLVDRGKEASHKLSRASGGVENAYSMESIFNRETNHDLLRQYDYSGYYKPPGISSFCPSSQAVWGNSETLSPQQFGLKGKTYTRYKERLGRRPFQDRTVKHRMVARLDYFRFRRFKIWPFRNRFMRNQAKYSTSSLYKPLFRREGSSGRHIRNRSIPMVEDVSVSSGEINREASPSNIDAQNQDSSHCPTVEESVMVSSIEQVTSATQCAPELLACPDDEERANKSLTAILLQSSRVDFLISCLRIRDKFSNVIARGIANSVRKSSINQYQTIWKRFQKFITSNKFSTISLHRVLLFFKNLFDSGLKPKTIIRYRSALVWPLKYFHIDVLDKNVSRLFSHFGIIKPPVLKLDPQWRVDDVLRLLKSKDFKDNDRCTAQNLLSKVIFLFAIASGNRISEISALSRAENNLIFFADNSKIELRPDSKFMFKNQTVYRIPSPIIIPAYIDKDIHSDLCPFQALKSYVDRTNHFVNREKKLWVDPIHGKPLGKVSISKIFCSIVNKAHGSHVKVNMHQSRSVATSLAFRAGLDIPEIMKRAFWSSPNPFFNNYLVNINSSIPCIALGQKT